MDAPPIDNLLYNTQQFIDLQESLLRIPSSRDGLRATPSQPEHATDAIMPDADPIRPGNSGGHADASPSLQVHIGRAISKHPTTELASPSDATPKSSNAGSPKKHTVRRSSSRKKVPAAMRNSDSGSAHPLSSGLNDTQVLPSQVYARYAQSVKEKATFLSTADATLPHTLQDGESGHVRLTDDAYDSTEEPQIIEDDSADEEDELAIETQARTQNVTSPTALSPITPAYAGNKRDARGRIVTPATRTPAADLTTFLRGQPKNKVGLSQLFNQTQATSSPMPEAFHSDPIFDRPSPDVNMKLQTSPSGRPSSSRTARDLPDPRDNYISVKESQELRNRRRRVRAAPAFWSSPGTSDGDDENEQRLDKDVDFARMKRKQAIDKGLQQIRAPANKTGQGRGSTRFRTSETVIGLHTPNDKGKEDATEDLVSDEGQFENEEDQSDGGSQDEYDELSQTIISSDLRQIPKTPLETTALRNPQTKRVESYPEKPQRAFTRHGGSPTYCSPTVKVANSQPVDSKKSNLGMPPRPQSPPSSNPVLHVSLSQDLSLSSNTRTQLAATPLTKGIVETSSIPPAPTFTSQIQDNNTTSANIDENVHSSPPIARLRDSSAEELQDETPEGDVVADRGDDEIPPQKKHTKARLSYTIPETSPSSSAVNLSTQLKTAALNGTRSLKGQKNAPQTLPTQPSIEPSNGTTPYETARTTVSSGQDSALHNQSRHAIRRVGGQSFHKMTDILADLSPPDQTESLPINVNILNESDEEFRVAIERPREELQRSARRRKVRDRALKEPASQLNATPSVVSESFKETNISKSGSSLLVVDRASTNFSKAARPSRQTQRMASPRLSTKSMLHDANHAESSNRVDNVGTDLQDVVSKDNVENANAPVGSTSNNTTRGSLLPSLNALSSRRVFTRFNGSTILYPATCLGFVDSQGTKLKVRFDDGTLAEVAPVHTRRLELRIGDHVKVDIVGYRKNTYVVQGFKVLAGSEAATGGDDSKTDILGHNTVSLVEKPRASLPLPDSPETHDIPITSLYITGTMWPLYKDREYIHASTPIEPSTRLQTPTDMAHVRSPPTSRDRRVKATSDIKFEHLGLLAQGLFSNMCFAISYSDNGAAKDIISRSIRTNGGLVLNEGFDELLSMPERVTKEQDHDAPRNEGLRKSISVLRKVSGLGFTALIADTHSRRKKYLQALALNLPCLSGRWVLDSVERGELLPWKRYLLPAGESSHLDGEVRSRTLLSYPDPSTVKFITTFDDKPRLLDGQRIIFVPGSRYAQKWQALTTLILIMGAAKVKRSGNIDNALALLKQDPGDWDCVFVEEENLAQARKALATLHVASRAKQGRDRKHVATSETDGNTRVVSDEAVIQSLILGEFVDG